MNQQLEFEKIVLYDAGEAGITANSIKAVTKSNKSGGI